jgi:hypothetical protein
MKMKSMMMLVPALAACGSGGADGTADGGSPTNGAQLGNVVISQTVLSVGPTNITTAVHAAGFGSGSGGGCTEQTSGSCVVRRCPSSGGDAGTTASGASAGAITFTGGTGAPITIMPGANGIYAANTMMSARWRAGDAVTVRAAGAAVPAFEAMVTFPASITVMEPAVSPVGMVRVPRSAPLTTRWTAMGTAGEVNVSVVSTAMNSVTIATCTYPISAGTAVIPSAVLGNLVAGSGSFSVTSTSATTVTAGGWTVAVAANSTGAASLAVVE